MKKGVSVRSLDNNGLMFKKIFELDAAQDQLKEEKINKGQDEVSTGLLTGLMSILGAFQKRMELWDSEEEESNKGLAAKMLTSLNKN